MSPANETNNNDPQTKPSGPSGANENHSSEVDQSPGENQDYDDEDLCMIEDTSKPLGSGNYEIQPGDCLHSIAFNHGYSMETLWNDSANETLRKKRESPNELLPGDRLTLPPKKIKNVVCQTGQKHVFRLKGSTREVKIILQDEGNPMANEDFIIVIDGQQESKVSDEKGQLSFRIRANAKAGKVIRQTTGEEIELRLGEIDPLTSKTGIQARLNNLGFDCGAVDGNIGPLTRQAIKNFQTSVAMKPTGKLCEQTLQQLKDKYGS